MVEFRNGDETGISSLFIGSESNSEELNPNLWTLIGTEKIVREGLQMTTND